MAFLNSSDLTRLRNPAGESPTAESKPDPAADVQAMISKIQALETTNKERDTKFQRMLEENSRQQEILRTQLAQRVEPVQPKMEAPATTSWTDLLGISTPQQTKEEPMASTPGSLSPAEIARLVDEKFEAKMQERLRQEQALAQQRQQQLDQLRGRLRSENADLLEDPVKKALLERTINGIERLNPSLSYEQIYEIAVAETRDVDALYRQAIPQGGSRMKSQQPAATPTSPYGISNYQQPSAPVRRNTDPFEGRVETGDRAEIEEARRREIKEIRENHLKKFIR